MKKLVATLIALTLLLTLAACVKRTADTTEETTAPTEQTTAPTTTDTATEPTESVTETEPPASTSEEDLPQLYRDIITSKKSELAAMDTGVLHTLLFDVDADGMEELFLMYPSQEDGKNTYGFDLYTIRDNETVTITCNHTVFYAIAGGQGGSVDVAQIDGRTYVYTRNVSGDWMTYNEEVRLMNIGGWNLYTLKEDALLLETQVSHSLITAYEEGMPLPDKPESSLPSYYFPEVSEVTLNDQPISLEEYGDWLNNMTILQDIKGYSDVH